MKTAILLLSLSTAAIAAPDCIYVEESQYGMPVSLDDPQTAFEMRPLPAHNVCWLDSILNADGTSELIGTSRVFWPGTTNPSGAIEYDTATPIPGTFSPLGTIYCLDDACTKFFPLRMAPQ